MPATKTCWQIDKLHVIHFNKDVFECIRGPKMIENENASQIHTQYARSQGPECIAIGNIIMVVMVPAAPKSRF